MSLKFSSKEIHFLRTESDQDLAGPPEFYFSDLAVSPSVPLENFMQRLGEADIPDDKFLCAVLKVPFDLAEEELEKSSQIFEACFQSLLDKPVSGGATAHIRGIWENLDETAFILAFWDYNQTDTASDLLNALKEKISKDLKTDVLMGAAWFPFAEFRRTQVPANALKAIDHAAFFGPGHTVYFDAVSLNISGDRLYQHGLYEAAIQEYQTGLELNPGNINLLNSLGVCFGVSGELNLAMDTFKKALALSSAEIMVIYNIGLIHQIREADDKALVYFKKAHAVNPDLFEVELTLGQLLLKTGKPGQALPYIEAACQLNPESGIAVRTMAEIFLELKDPDRAGVEFNKAVKLIPSDGAALSGYAQAMLEQGKNLKIALTFAQKALGLDPDNEVFKQRAAAVSSACEQAEQNKAPNIKSA